MGRCQPSAVLARRGYDLDPETLEERLAEFDLRARRLVHLGEVSYKEQIDPLSLAVSQTFKIEKAFDRDDLGCTEAVPEAVRPTLPSLGAVAQDNLPVTIAGSDRPSMTYYIVRHDTNK